MPADAEAKLPGYGLADPWSLQSLLALAILEFIHPARHQ